MPRKEHHVVPNPNGGWDVKRENAQRASGHYETKADAEAAGRQKSINGKTELIIHGKNGRFQRSDSYGKDPCPPRDR